ncbi:MULTISPECIES: hypothetical protein [Bacillus]|uniref:Uncharacterized protein n=1 Tax=Bacillus glycinifermentans TaxID=1664069 RepID=A0AAJ3Z1S2_9BACI|nr:MULTISPECIES: hypothetical protein [Bacillus]MDU0071723.1 hypothetical protein [Bacillus sp. IG6]MED8019884.1 hypothetical protein [Bacillus glycinifermentans]QAT64698.1 hypothetical protein EQZ20_07150 [Bacillus glycinifermentans]QAT67128.1 hypothetical protein EQZ20_21080 [Bacillus glycinifermentans]
MKIEYVPELDAYRVGELITADREVAEEFLRMAEELAKAGHMVRDIPEPKSRQVFAECVRRK